MDTKCLVVDANILLRAVFGTSVLTLLNDYADTVTFHVPDVCFDEARKHIPAISLQKKVNPNAAFAFLERVESLVAAVSLSLYEQHEITARRRIAARDVKDWPVVATALLLNSLSGPKTRTSSAAASPPGPRTTSKSSWKTPNRSQLTK